MDGEKLVASAPLPQTQLGEATIPVSSEETRDLVVQLTGHDAIAADDRAPVVVEAGPAALAVVGDRTEEAVATGGAPGRRAGARRVARRARGAPHPAGARPTGGHRALRRHHRRRPARLHARATTRARCVRRFGRRVARRAGDVAQLPRRSARTSSRCSGKRSAGTRAVPWASMPRAARRYFGEAASSLADLAPRGRAKLAEQDLGSYEPLLKWSDGLPLVAHRTRGRGDVWLTTLPFSVETSDFALRPGFLALLDGFVTEAKQRATPRRGDVGSPWTFAGARTVEAEGPQGPVAVVREDGVLRLVPALAGAYHVTIDGAKELRVAAPLAREIDLRARPVAASATSSALGGGVAIVDVSWMIALGLLGLVAAELIARAIKRSRTNDVIA